MSASPASTPVTTPDEETVATAGLDDCQVAWLVTFWVVPFEKFAVAVKGDEAPTAGVVPLIDRKSTRLNSSHGSISYAVFCLKKKKPHEATGDHRSSIQSPDRKPT